MIGLQCYIIDAKLEVYCKLGQRRLILVLKPRVMHCTRYNDAFIQAICNSEDCVVNALYVSIPKLCISGLVLSFNVK